MMLSKTVSGRHSRERWKVRAIPARQMACGGNRVMSRASNSMLPAAALYSPVTTLKNVVLPEPFGPIKPRISPRMTESASA